MHHCLASAGSRLCLSLVPFVILYSGFACVKPVRIGTPVRTCILHCFAQRLKKFEMVVEYRLVLVRDGGRGLARFHLNLLRLAVGDLLCKFQDP